MFFCGKCGTANPEGNSFCRRCGHRLADDIVDEQGEQNRQLRSPTLVEGVEVERYPLVDPESGEIIPIDTAQAEGPKSQKSQKRDRGGTILWSVGIHLAGVIVMTMVAGLVVFVVEREWMERLAGADPSEIWADQAEMISRAEQGNLTPEQQAADAVRVLRAGDMATLTRAQLVHQGALFVGFFLAGLIVTRMRKPDRFMDVGLGALMVGVLMSLCCSLPIAGPIAAPLGFVASMVGTFLGKRMGKNKR